MLQSIVLAAMACIGFIMIFRPIYGILYFVFTLYLAFSFYVPALAAYRLNLYFTGMLFLCCFLHRPPSGIKKFFFIVFFILLLATLSFLINGTGAQPGEENIIFILFKCSLLPGIILSYINNKTEINKFIKTLFLGGFCNAVFAILQLKFGFQGPANETGRSEGRYGGFQEDPNLLAALLVFLLPLAYYYYKNEKSKLLQKAYLLFFIVSVLAILITLSRSGLIALILVIACVFMKNIKNIATVFILLTVFLVFAYVGADLWKARENTVETNFSGKKALDSSSTSRLDAWSGAIKLGLRNPLLGVGHARFQKVMLSEYGQLTLKNVHNTFLHVLAEFGMLCCLCYLSLFWISFKALSKLKRGNVPFYSEIAGYCRIGLAAFTLCSMFFSLHFYYLLWIYVVIPLVLNKGAQAEYEFS